VPSAEYPYYLLTYIPAVHKRNSTQNNKILAEMMGSNNIILPVTLAAKLGIKAGERVRVWSRAGAVEAPAQLTETIREDCVLIAHGFGHRSRLLTVTGGRGVRDGDLVPAQSVDEVVAAGNYGGASCIMDAVVNIGKAGAA
jgi:thiosulfate reductase/polysulfide reductase chain A